MVGVLLAGRLRSRAEMLLNEVLLPVDALLVEAALIQLMGGSVGGELLSEGILMGGLLLLALLISPTVERLFGMITRSRLLELCDLQRPLLRKLSEAPGTFEHTLMICGLAEEGVRAIGGDVDLVRTGALYHDVGKLHAPQWFIENQQGDNPHDHLDDPGAAPRSRRPMLMRASRWRAAMACPSQWRISSPNTRARCGWATSGIGHVSKPQCQRSPLPLPRTQAAIERKRRDDAGRWL